MKITKIETFTTSIPLKEKSVLARSKITESVSVNVKIHTDEGVTGLGTARLPGPNLSGETKESMIALIENYIGPGIMGYNLLETEKLFAKIDKIKVGNEFTKTAIDIAVYDAIGKKMGLPIYKIFGGPSRESVELIGWIGIDEPDVVTEKALNFVKQGFKTLKLKIGTPDDLSKDIERVKEVRKAIGPSIALRVDINSVYSPSEAVRVLNEISQYNLQVVEDPIGEHYIDGWKRIAKSVDVPLGADLCIRSPMTAYNMISKNIVDFIKMKIVKVGGFHNALKIISIAESAGVQVLVGRGTGSNIEALAELHLLAIRKHTTLAGEMVSPIKLTDDIVDQPMKIENGMAFLPTSPGIGVNLVEEKVEKYLV